MEILVCIKQVPATAEIEVDEKTGVLKRDSTAAKINPYDLYALEMALCLREEYGGNVHVLSMGPSQAKKALLEALHIGSDKAALLSDRRFAGADVLATARALAAGICTLGSFDLILCGKQTTDGDTAQVGPEIAEFLGIEHASYVQKAEVEEDSIIVDINLGDSILQQKMHMPCLLTVEKDANSPRLPSYRRSLNKSEDDITCFQLEDLNGIDENSAGLLGSPTQVERIFPPEHNTNKQIISGNADEIAVKLHAVLQAGKYI